MFVTVLVDNTEDKYISKNILNKQHVWKKSLSQE